MQFYPHEERVRTMMQGFGQATPSCPMVPDEKTRVLRCRLLLEEVLEFIRDSGCYVSDKFGESRIQFDQLEVKADPKRAPDFGKMIDGLADISVVNTGAFIAFGVPMAPCLELVDLNNLEKVAKGHLDEGGKFIKPEGHQPPDFDKLLIDLGWLGD